MATFNFSALSNGLTYYFFPNVDRMVFDDTRISASQVFFDYLTSPTTTTYLTSFIENKEIGLASAPGTITSSNITFADGSKLLVGDNRTGTANDDANNKLTGGLGNDQLIGLGGNDTLIGGAGNDFLDGGQGNDSLVGGAGVEFFFDLYGSNVLRGDAGNDFFFALSSIDSGANQATGGTGRDTYYTFASFASAFFSIPTNFNVLDFATGGSGDVINISGSLYGSALQGYYQGQDPFTEGFIRVVQDGANALVQHDLDGTAGTYSFGTVLTLNNTNAAAAAATVTGYVLGSIGSEILTGDASNQILFAAAGNDTVNGGKGGDNMFGGSGRDTYVVDDRGDTVTESSNDSALSGALIIGPDGSEGYAGLDDITDTVLAAVTYSIENAQFVENLTLTGTVAREATGNSLDNSITGNALNNLLQGLGGNDTLSGAAGNDALYGGEGDDRFIWGTGDVLNGEAGTDTLKLASGNLNLTVLANTKILGIEQIDMISGGNNTLMLNKADVLALSSETDTLLVMGNSGDKVDIVGAGFTAGALSGDYRTYNLTGGGILMVETDVTVI